KSGPAFVRWLPPLPPVKCSWQNGANSLSLRATIMRGLSMALGGMIVFLLASSLRGAEPTIELSPTPRIIVLPDPVYSPPVSFYRKSQYDVWQYVAVDRSGRFRPRVVPQLHQDGYYLYNGHYYPWIATHQRDFMPYAMD